METSTSSNYAQLWIEEREILAERAALVPDNGTIVEIGTAQGGSALIFHAAAGHRGVKIYSFDIAPSAEAYENLKNTSVAIVAQSSAAGARAWSQTVQTPIDLLFIDGSHALGDVFQDFNLWGPLVRLGGEIIFHDFDPIERGGLAHLGVRVALDTVLRCGILDKPSHEYRLLYGRVRSPDNMQLEAKDCYETLVEFGRRIVRVRDGDYSRWQLVGDRRFAELLRGCLNLDSRAEPILPEEASAMDVNYLVFARPLMIALEVLRERKIPKESVVTIDNLQVCYFVAHALRRNRDYLLRLTSSREEFFRWEEILFMLEQGFGASEFPDVVVDASAGTSVARLSEIIAQEQVRLSILSYLLKTFVDWTP